MGWLRPKIEDGRHSTVFSLVMECEVGREAEVSVHWVGEGRQ